MKRLLIITYILFIFDRAYSPVNKMILLPVSEVINPYIELYQATTIVESKCNPLAYNETEQATGIVQIRPIRLKDYNERTGKKYSLQDCYNPSISKEIFMYYASKHLPTDYEAISKKWNGKGKSNEIYWQKVLSEMEKINLFN